jgi:glycosyltransferase involved in cell wall biosynthesis
MKLGIISHTEHYYDSNGVLTGWGPTIREINFLSVKFDKICHAAYLHPGPPPSSSLPYESDRIEFFPLPPSGGKKLINKLSVVTFAPQVLKTVSAMMKECDAVQLRVPTGMANYLMPWLTMKPDKPLIWVKYAGNWMQESAPAGYAFQKWWLKKNLLNCKVTINGRWHNQPSHCISFENPCIDEHERERGKKIIGNKSYSPPYIGCFIGRIEDAKGVGRILEAAKELYELGFRELHFVGMGKADSFFPDDVFDLNGIGITYHGSMSRDKISDLLERAHFLLLPSTASEGFPKVIAEAANYGAIPIVSDISSIGQYINGDNGFVWNINVPFREWISKIELTDSGMTDMSNRLYQLAGKFTFEHYYNNLRKYILNDH